MQCKQVVSLFQQISHFFFFATIAKRATMRWLVQRRLLLLRRQNTLASVTLIGVGFLQIGIDSDPLVKHKAIAIVVVTTALFKVFRIPPSS